MNLPRIPPARCTGTFLPSLLDDPQYIAEPKLDGGRYMLYVERDGVFFYSRQRFPAINKAAQIPHITAASFAGEGMVLDGEILLPTGKQLGDTTGIMNSLPSKAHATQELVGKLVYNVFDILFLNGQDLRKKPLRERRVLLERVIAQLNNPWITAVPQSSNKTQLLQSILDAGGEGVVLKHLGASYGLGWVKCKRRSDFSVVISGYQPGNGKYSTTLGAVLFSVYKDGALVEVGKCSGMTDEERDDIWRNRETYLHKVIDVFAQEITKDGRMRHPVWHRLRADVDPQSCTWIKLHDDARKAFTKS